MSNNSDASALDLYYPPFKATVYNSLFTGMVYGAYIVAYVTSAYVLLRRPGFTSSLPRMFMFGITTLMFALGIIALVLVTTFLWCQSMKAFLADSQPGPSFYTSSVVWATITRLMYILSDIICAWRTVALWSRDKRVIAILLFFILGSTAAAVCDLYFSIMPLFGTDKRSIEDPGKVGERALLFVVGPTLATNLLSTGMIAWKAWQRRGPVREHLCGGSGSMRVDRVFALLIESGFIYCCIWILYGISAFGVFLDPGFTFMAGVSGLYPTLIIILVAMQRSPVDHCSTHSTGVQLPAFGSPRDSNVLRPVFMIHHEYASDSDTRISSSVFMKTSDEEKSSDEEKTL
ncbi:hypothetical protein V8E53_013028 [Lactarius tabidus]